jgi:NAD-dependent dihydropyrimidine dehydrogenase PreA subunit
MACHDNGVEAPGKAARQSRIVVCCCAHYERVPREAVERVLGALQGRDMPVEVVPDLCGMAADRDPRLANWARADALHLVACYPRALKWLFNAAGAPLAADRARYSNLRVQPAEDVLAGLFGGAPDHTNGGSLPEAGDGWVPWFPVIDYDRCKNCKQCMNFCLFGVYGLSQDGRVQVQQPASCKTNCPACARVCPAKAIIFPKYTESPVNGDEVRASDAPAAEAKGDLRSLLQGDVYSRIRKREPGRKRFSTESQEGPSDRSCPTLDALRRDLDIPDDVLASLSPAELGRLRKKSPEKAMPQSSDATGNEGKAHGDRDNG